ncbi:MAG: hypothetical protein WB802_13995 [Candidatus Dormiibacterota bacterium]|jgi:hypothetical protein
MSREPRAPIEDGAGEPRAAIGDRGGDLASDGAREAGDAVCWLHLVCPACGELGGHLPSCRVAAEMAGGQRRAEDPP